MTTLQSEDQDQFENQHRDQSKKQANGNNHIVRKTKYLIIGADDEVKLGRVALRRTPDAL